MSSGAVLCMLFIDFSFPARELQQTYIQQFFLPSLQKYLLICHVTGKVMAKVV